MTTLRGFKYTCVIVEGTLQKLENGSWRGKILPASVLGSIASWRLRYNLEFIYAGSPSLAANETFRYLKAFHNLMQEFSRRFK